MVSSTTTTLLLLCGFLIAVPNSAAPSSSEIDKATVQISEHDFADQAASLVDKTGAELNEPEDKLEKWESDLQNALSKAQSDHDEQGMNHAQYSSALLNTAQELLKKHVNTAAANSFSTEDVEAVLQKSGALRDSVAAHMQDNPEFTTKEKHLLLERARYALGDERGALLEQSVKRKDATPCIHVLEQVNGFPLADFDPPRGQAFHCQSQCLELCKNDLRNGASKFQIDRDEMAAMGMSPREIDLTGGQPQIGAKCDGNRCRCLDATATKNKVMQMIHSGMGMIDLTKQEQFEGYPSEQSCMMSCRDEMGIVEPYGFQAKFEGVCFDEAWSFGS